MNTSELQPILWQEVENHGRMSIYTLNDNGNLIPVTGAKVVIQRDETDVPILVIER
jgi:hypothetical protein